MKLQDKIDHVAADMARGLGQLASRHSLTDMDCMHVTLVLLASVLKGMVDGHDPSDRKKIVNKCFVYINSALAAYRSLGELEDDHEGNTLN